MRSREEVAAVTELVRAGWNDCEITRETGIPRGTVRDWRRGRTPNFERSGACLVCSGDVQALPLPAYTYLLGLYLGDGCLTACPREVYKLRIACAERYPDLVRDCELAMGEILPNKVGRTRKTNERCWDVYSHSKHWHACSRSMGPVASTNGGSSSPGGSRNWSTSTRVHLFAGCSTPTGAGC